MSASTRNRYLVPLLPIVSLFFLWGAANNLNDVLMKHFKKVFTLSDFQTGLVQSAFYFGYFCFAIPAALFMKRFGYKAFVIDHAAKPEIAAETNLPAWQRAIDDLAELPNVACKLSGPLTEAAGKDVGWAIDRLFDAYAPDRLIRGSDWPVPNLAGDYAGWLALAKSAIPEEAHAAVFKENARRIYRL